MWDGQWERVERVAETLKTNHPVFKISKISYGKYCLSIEVKAIYESSSTFKRFR